MEKYKTMYGAQGWEDQVETTQRQENGQLTTANVEKHTVQINSAQNSYIAADDQTSIATSAQQSALEHVRRTAGKLMLPTSIYSLRKSRLKASDKANEGNGTRASHALSPGPPLLEESEDEGTRRQSSSRSNKGCSNTRKKRAQGRGRSPQGNSNGSSDDDSKRKQPVEQATINCPFIPNAGNIDSWMTTLRDNVNVCAERLDDEVMYWFADISRAGTTYDSLAKVHKKFMTVDRKMGAAILKETVKTPSSQLHKTLLADRLRLGQANPPTVPRGQQVVFRVLESVRTSEELGTIYSGTDIVGLWCHGQSIKDLQEFRRSWDYYEAKATGLNEQTKTALLLERMDYLKYFEDNYTTSIHGL